MLSLLSTVEKAMFLASLASSSGFAGATPRPVIDKYVFWLGAALVVLSYLLIMAGVGLYLADHYQLSIALMVLGLVVLFTVLCVVVGVRCYKAARQRKMQNAVKNTTSDISNILSDITNDMSHAYKDHVGMVAAIVAAIGFLSARKII